MNRKQYDILRKGAKPVRYIVMENDRVVCMTTHAHARRIVAALQLADQRREEFQSELNFVKHKGM